MRLVSVMRQFEMLQKAVNLGGEMNRAAIEQVARVGIKETIMIRALYSAASGMTAQQTNVDNIAHNLANANTTGFKARRAQFQDLLYQNVVQPGSAAGQQTVVPTGLQIGLGTRAASNEIIFTQGSFSQTNNPLDLVIQGRGFFQVRQAVGRARLQPRRLVPPGPRRQPRHLRRQSDRAADHHPLRRAADHDRAGRHRQLHAAGPDRGAAGRARSSSPTSRIRPA